MLVCRQLAVVYTSLLYLLTHQVCYRRDEVSMVLLDGWVLLAHRKLGCRITSWTYSIRSKPHKLSLSLICSC